MQGAPKARLVRRSDRDAVVAASAPLQPPTLDEPGCRAYSFTADPLMDDRVWVFELWDDATWTQRREELLGQVDELQAEPTEALRALVL